MTYSEMKDSGVEGMGAVPTHWKLTPIKYVASLDPPCQTSHLSSDDEVSFAPMECIRNDKRIPRIAPKSNDNGTYSKFMEGDIAIAKVTPCFENGNICVMQNLRNGFAFGSSELFSVRAHSIQNRFLFYCMQSPYFVDGGTATMTGVAGLKRVSSHYMRNAVIALPPEDEQASISAFLDSKCSTIDSILTAIEISIEEYKCWKASVIYQAVTKGLDPDAPMKNSGIPWFGQLPAHWRITKTLHCLSMAITDGPHTTPILYDSGVPFISAEAVSCGNGKIDFTHMRGYISEDFYKECCKKYIPQIDDIYMIKSGATTGRVAIVDTDRKFTIWSPLAAFRANRNRILPKFLFYALQSDSYQKQVELGWTYGTQQNIGMRTLETLKIPLPPLTEQAVIADFLDAQCSTIDAIISEKQALIAELEAYKKSLIYEAVTGKRKVG